MVLSIPVPERTIRGKVNPIYIMKLRNFQSFPARPRARLGTMRNIIIFSTG